jgi:hypothetical protein
MIAPLRWPLACYPCSIEIYEDSSICWFLPAIAEIAAKIRLSIAVAVSCTSSLFSVVTRVVGCVLGHSPVRQLVPAEDGLPWLASLHNAIVGDQSDLVIGLRLCGAGLRPPWWRREPQRSADLL